MRKFTLKTLLISVLLMGANSAWADVTWDFTNWSDETIANLNADGTWAYTSNSGTANDGYWNWADKNAQSAVALTANSVAISELSGLTFTQPASSGGRIRIDNRTNKKALYFYSYQEKVHVPALTAGKKVSIHFRTASASKPIKMYAGNSNVVAYNQADESTLERTDEFIVSSSVELETTVAFNVNGGSGVGGVNIYSITVSDATAEELLYADCKVKFGSDDYVTATTLWTFDQYAANDVIATYNAVTNYAGLYAKGHNNTNPTKVAEKASGTQTVGGYSVSTVNALNTPGGAALSTFPSSASVIPVDCIGINVGVPGTLYVVGTSNNQSEEGYTCNIFFNSTSEPTTQTLKKNTISVFSKTNTEIGTYVIRTSKGGWHACAIMFIPTTATAMTKTVTLTAVGGGYATFSAPQSYTVPEGVTAYYVSDVDDTENKATLTSISAGNVIPACTGVILYKEGVSSNTEITLTSSESYSAVTNSMQPNLAAYALAANNGTYYNYTLAYDEGPVFMHSSGEGTLAAGKAFLRTTVNVTGGEAKALRIVVDGDEATGVEAPAVAEVEEDEVLYNMAGLRVGKDYKGIVINQKGVKRFNK